jgi:(p)ppGpp synthase/HD superfamily hydrolase
VEYKELYAKAYALAKERHNGQKRWDGSDYFSTHLVRVSQDAQKLAFYQYTKEIVSIVGLLHDIVEDTPTSIDEIYDKFGKVIGNSVKSMTHLPDEEYHRYIERLSVDTYAILVKLADLNHNLETVTGNKRKLYLMARSYLELVLSNADF